MSVKLRLSLTGRSHQISYRLVAQDTHAKRDGKFLEILGFLNEFQKDNVSKFNKPRIEYYLSKGATFTPSAKFVFENGKLPPKVKKAKPAKTTDQPAPEAKSEVSEAATQPQVDKSEPKQEAVAEASAPPAPPAPKAEVAQAEPVTTADNEEGQA